MRVTHIQDYDTPKLPTSRVLGEHPELLRLVPRRWQRNTLVLSALAGVCTLTAGGTALAGEQQKDAAVSRVAPIFEHGDGRGSFGCISVSPPTFLSEDEARQVIVEEGKRAGIAFVADIRAVGGLELPRTDKYAREKIAKEEKPHAKEPAGDKPGTKFDMQTYAERARKEEGPVTEIALDGTDERRHISYEYVSRKDFEDWETRHPLSFSSVSVYDIIGAARNLRDSLASRRPAGAYAVFYDPVARRCTSSKQSAKLPIGDTMNRITEQCSAAATAEETAREELRAQVRDFIAWLKSQGVI